MRHRFIAALLGASLATAVNANGPTGAQRKAILDAARPVAQSMANQPVRIKVDRLNVDSGWAVLVGELVAPPGGRLDWRKARDCEPDLDKMLWVVLAKADDHWRVAQIEVCSPEPPYWYLQELTWPCGVYAGLQRVEGETLETECRRAHGAAPR